MTNASLSALKEYHPDIDKFSKFIEITEKFFQEKNLLLKENEELFFNHLISLIKRIEQNSQTDSELIDLNDFSDETKKLTEKFINKLQINITEFEKMLLYIHFQKIIGGKNE